MRSPLPFLVGCFLILGSFARAGDADAPTGESIDLVRKLGDGDFRVRENAERELARRGAAALVEVKRGADDADLEIRRRCQSLLVALQKSDVDRLLSPFVSGKEVASTPLPGWTAVRDVMGDDGASRFLYALIYKNDRAFLETLEKDPKALVGQADARIRKHLPAFASGWALNRKDGKPPALEDIASLLLIATAAKPPLDLNHSQRLISLLGQPQVQQSVSWSHALRRLTEKWLEQKCDDPNLSAQAARLATIYGCDHLIETKFRPATEKLIDSAAANPTDFNLFHRALNQARQHNMSDLIEGRLKPAVLKSMAVAAASDPIDFNRLSALGNVCQNIGGMEQDLKPVLRPALTTLFKKQAEQMDDSTRLYPLVMLAQISQSQDLIAEVLRPAYRSKLLRLTRQEKELAPLTTAYQHAQLLGMQEEIDAILKPAATAAIAALAAKDGDAGHLQQAVHAAQMFQLRETLRPVAEKLLDGVAASNADISRIAAVVQLAKVADVPSIAEKIDQKVKPAARKAVVDAAEKSLNSANVSQSLMIAEQLHLKEGVALALKAAALKSLPSYTRGQAIHHLAKFADKGAIAQLEPLLNDTGELGMTSVNGQSIRTQIGDAVLGALVHASDQKLDDYKFAWPRIVGGGVAAGPVGRAVLAAPSFYGFDSDADRQASRKKWQEYRAEKK